MLSRRRLHDRSLNYWPGFVDALTVLLLAFTFLLTVFVLAQYYLAQEISGKETALQKLTRQIGDLTDLLSLERSAKASLEDTITSLKSTLADRDKQAASDMSSPAAGTSSPLSPDDPVTQVARLNQQIAALRRQLSAIEAALDASQMREQESQNRVNDLGSRLNVALAQKVQELSRYRSDFFGRLREVLGSRNDIRIVGDRFVFPSEVFFAASQASLEPSGQAELDKLADVLLVLERNIPPDIPWVLRVDGHTDQRPIATPQFPSNWALSAGRAIAVVQYLITKGISPQRLVAAGFGEFQPLDLSQTDDAFRRNRRIELKLTER